MTKLLLRSSLAQCVSVAILLVILTLAFGPATNRVLSPSPVEAQSLTIEYAAIAHETITVSSVAIGFTASTYAPTNQIAARAAECTVETAGIREWPDGTAPTANAGRPYASGARFTIVGANNMRKFQMIRSSGSDSTVSCGYYR